jgi:3'(2'),5'-bisphosphate nucleotidase
VDYRDELATAEAAARAAGAIILRHYARGAIRVDTKADQSPVTQADLDANQAIVDILRAAFPDDGLLTEELPDGVERLAKRRVWIVDPLDGTRDFVARTDQFCVHVGLAVDGAAVVGAVHQPVAGLLFSARAGAGAFCRPDHDPDGAGRPLRVSASIVPGELRVGVSRLNASDRLGRCLIAAGMDRRAVAMGASVKQMVLARGELDAVINLSPGEQEWDTCAPEVVVHEAGGVLTDGDGRPFRYNQPDPTHPRGSLASNGACHTTLLALIADYLDEST